MTAITKNFPLLTEIDEQINFDNLDWNKNAFQTLLTSNLPPTTIVCYAIQVGLRRLESSLYEVYWDVTADALNELSQFVFTTSSNDQTAPYLYEAKCQLLMYASIAILKLNTIRRRSINEGKLSCASMFLLLLEQSKFYETPSIKNEYSSCMCSMRSRYLKRFFLIGEWLPTLSKNQLMDIQPNHERYLETMIDHLFPAVSSRDQINGFIEESLLNNSNETDPTNEEATSSGFVFIQRFPKFNEKTIEQNSVLMHTGLVNTLEQLNHNITRKLICCVWTLACMIEADRVSLRVLNNRILRENISTTPIDFEQKPILADSLNERDVIVFLLLCAQQNVRLPGGDSSLYDDPGLHRNKPKLAGKTNEVI